jgi:hypothetical protein
LLLAIFFFDSSTLKTEAVLSSETLIHFYRTIRRNIPEDSIRQGNKHLGSINLLENFGNMSVSSQERLHGIGWLVGWLVGWFVS